MFISVGPSGFTIAGVVNMGQILPRVVTEDFMGNGYLTGQVCKIASAWMGLWLWGLAFWFLIVSIGAHWSCVRDGRMTFAMTWYSYIFPNTGKLTTPHPIPIPYSNTFLLALTTATFAIGHALNNVPIQVVGCVMACLLVVAWFTIFSIMIRAVIMKDILWPQKQEDREEGGWKALPNEKQACDSRACDEPDTNGNGTGVEMRETSSSEPVEETADGIALPVIAERLIDESVRGRTPRQNDSMV